MPKVNPPTGKEKVVFVEKDKIKGFDISDHIKSRFKYLIWGVMIILVLIALGAIFTFIFLQNR